MKREEILNTIERIEKEMLELKNIIKTNLENEISNNEEIVKKISWKDIGEFSGYYINDYSCIIKYKHDKMKLSMKMGDNRNIFSTKEEAEACLALSQISQWKNKYNTIDGSLWIPDWTKSYNKFCIEFICDEIATNNYGIFQRFLAFPTMKIRDKFLKDFEYLIIQAKPLL